MEIRFARVQRFAAALAWKSARVLAASGTLFAATHLEAGLIPRVDPATAQQGAAQLAIERLKFADRKQPGFEELEAAVALFGSGKIDETLIRLEAAADANDRLPPPAVMLSRMFFATGQIAPGRQRLEQAAVEHADHPDVYLALADLALVEGRLTDAALQYEKALTLTAADADQDPQKLIAARSGLGAVAERREQWTEAERLLSICCKLSPHNALFKQRLARIQFEQKRYEEAAASLTQAEHLAGEMQSPALVMGHWHHIAGNSVEAEAWMQTALEQAPDAPTTLIAAAVWCLEVDRPEEAQTYIERLAKVKPDAPQLLRLKGVAATYLEDFETAESCFQKLMIENPGDFTSSNQLALALIEQPSDSDQRRALQIAALNTRQYPDSPEAHATLGWIRYRLGQLDAAERIFQPLIAAAQLSPDGAYYAARLLIARERIDEGRKLLSEALAASRGFSKRKACRNLLESLPERVEAESNQQRETVKVP